MRENKLKILYITSHWPGNYSYGAQQRVLHIGQMLQKVGHISMVIVSHDIVDSLVVERSKLEFNIAKVITPTRIRQNIVERLRHEIDPRYLLTDSYSIAPDERTEILNLIRRCDLVWVHTVKTANRLGIQYFPHSVIDIDDMPSSIYFSESKITYSAIRRLLNLRMALLWRLREKALQKRFNILVVCNKADRRHLGNKKNTMVIPNGFDVPNRTIKRIRCLPLRLGFCGTFKYEPNVEGVKWFILEVWPLIRKAIPGVRLRLIGQGSEQLNRYPDIDGLGWVENNELEISTWAGMVVPIRMGGGTRIKIAEAFALHCPVVSTSFGALGYEVHDSNHLIISNGSKEFAQGCIRILEEPDFAEQLAEKAYKLFLRKWNWKCSTPVIEKAVLMAIRELT